MMNMSMLHLDGPKYLHLKSTFYLIDGLCDENWFEHAENCYLPSKPGEKCEWNTANSTCNEMGAVLTSVADEAENDFLVTR